MHISHWRHVGVLYSTKENYLNNSSVVACFKLLSHFSPESNEDIEEIYKNLRVDKRFLVDILVQHSPIATQNAYQCVNLLCSNILGFGLKLFTLILSRNVSSPFLLIL